MYDLDATVRRLHTAGLTPTEIARTLDLPVGDVLRLVAGLPVPPVRDVVGCWISPRWATGMRLPADDRVRAEGSSDEVERGLVSVLVVREHGFDSVSVCGYLVDVFCLGVKDVIAPLTLSMKDVPAYSASFFRPCGDDPVPVPVELAADLVLGAVEYARGFGFEPHPDFDQVAAHLGPRQGPSTFTFGRDGRPHYIPGPEDDTFAIMRMLDAAVGRGGYGFTMRMTVEDDALLLHGADRDPWVSAG